MCVIFVTALSSTCSIRPLSLDLLLVLVDMAVVWVVNVSSDAVCRFVISLQIFLPVFDCSNFQSWCICSGGN